MTFGRLATISGAMGQALDTVTRFVMLVLAGLVSLSIIGAIASMTSGEAPGGRAEQRPQREMPIAPSPQAQPTPQARPQGGTAAIPGSSGEAVLVAAPPGEPDNLEKWLEAIAYALMAVVGLLALIAVILWRGLAALRDR